MRQETLTLFLVNLAGIMESADEKVLPAVYKEVLTDLHTDPIGLGSLTLYRSIVQSSCYPLAIYLARRHNRAHVIALGAFLWAAATFLVAISSTFFQVAVSRGLNGIGLAIVIPAIQSLVADSTDDSNRGTAFGWLQLAGNFGAIIGGFCSVLLASTSVMGIPGWRIAFHLVALMSLIVGILVRLFATDPHFSKNNSGAEQRVIHKCFWSEVKELIQEAKAVMRIPSFQIIVAQGVSGTIPGSALTFAPMWLELVGFSHKKTAFLWTLTSYWIFTRRSVWWKDGGYPCKTLTQFRENYSGSNKLEFAYSFGCSFAANSPIFAEIVPARSRTSIYALDRTFETILSSFAPAVVGILAQHVYGFQPIPKASSSSGGIETDRQNAASLAKALFTVIGIPMAICCFIYSFLHCTYPRDRDRARMDALIESEMQKLDEANSTSSNVDIDFQGGKSDNSDEKASLLSH
ncbi:Multidrug resistance protein 1 [Morella rubra]|uniref:Multidrug resistance protein 1 n=1 Tax=Morella rubra TaxID=262757 RepID=A0A6A1V7D2_9ROSI|nr:Multidrug resistance protein 1 [Morella rubra]